MNVVSPRGRNSIAVFNCVRGRREFATNSTDMQGNIVTRFNFSGPDLILVGVQTPTTGSGNEAVKCATTESRESSTKQWTCVR